MLVNERLGEPFNSAFEEDRWWEAFNAALNPACRSWLRSPDHEHTPSLKLQVQRAAEIADAAIAAAKKRGRL